MPKQNFSHVKAVSGAVQLLEKQLTNGDSFTRKCGVESVPQLKAPTDQIRDLAVRLFANENWFVRRTAADVLTFVVLRAKDGDSDPATEIAGKMLESEDPEIRRCGSQTLVAIAEQPKEEEKDILPGDFKREPPESEVARANALSKAAAAEIAKRLSDDRPYVRENAVETMGRVGPWADVHADALAQCVGDTHVVVRHETLRTLNKLGTVVSGACPKIASLFEHVEEAIRHCAKRALLCVAKQDGPAAAEGTVPLLASPNLVARRAAAQLLLELGPDAAIHCETVAKLLDDEDVGMRVMATRVLVASAKSPDLKGKKLDNTLKIISSRMGREEEDKQRAAVDAMRGLAAVMGKAARSQGRIFIEDTAGVNADQLTEQKIRAIRVLGGACANAKPYIEDIVKELESADWRIRREAIHALEDLKEHAAEEGAKEVAKRLLHEEPDVRRAAAETLGRMGVHAGGYSRS
jgi:HEAT repeat protein